MHPHYTKQRLGRPQMPLAVMLRIYFLQQWYYLSDPGAEEALYDMHSMREFAGLDLAHEAVPDETTILNFRHLLERHNLTEVLFEAVSSYLQEQSLLMRVEIIIPPRFMDDRHIVKTNSDCRQSQWPISAVELRHRWGAGRYYRAKTESPLFRKSANGGIAILNKMTELGRPVFKQIS